MGPRWRRLGSCWPTLPFTRNVSRTSSFWKHDGVVWARGARLYQENFNRRLGTKNVLLLKNEDMLPSAVENEGGVLDQLSSFTGLARSEFPRHMYSRVSNCNDKAMEDCGESRSSSYHISNDREMLPESRTLVYLHFWEECKIWAKEFGIEFPDCLNVMDQPQVRRLT